MADSFKVNYGDVSFRAAGFEMQHLHPSDDYGQVGRSETQITVKLTILSESATNLGTSARTALYEHANWHRGDSRNEARVLTLEVGKIPGEPPHTYTVDYAWLQSFAEHQDAGTNQLVLDLLFRGYIVDKKGSAIS